MLFDLETLKREIFPDDVRAAELALAAQAGDSFQMKALVAQGASPNAHGDAGITPLQIAIGAQSREGVIGLLYLGADPDVIGYEGQGALHIASTLHDPWFAQVLLDAGADINLPHARTGNTPLAHALAVGTDEAFVFLLDHGADVHHVSQVSLNTALHQAALVDAPGHVLRLLERGVDPGARNRQGATFQDYLFMADPLAAPPAKRLQYAAVVAWLRGHGVGLQSQAGDFSAPGNDGSTPPPEFH